MAYNPENPIGSNSPKDLAANAQNFDFLSLGEQLTYPDRKGVPRKSWKGMEVAFDSDQARREAGYISEQSIRAVNFKKFLNNSGFEIPVEYVAGLDISRETQIIRYQAELYRAKDTALPFTTSSWGVDGSRLFAAGDAVLRQNLADPVQGSAILSWLVDGGRSKYTRIAHRGYAGLAPENTMTAFSNAYHVGADVLESDVQISSDGHCVIIHDDTVNRTTTGTGNVKDLTLAQLQALDSGSKFSAKFASSRIPTFDELIKFAKPRFKTLYSEIKAYRTQADIDIMLSVIAANRADDLVNLSSFILSDLTYVRARNKKIALGFLTNNSIATLPQVVALGGDLTMLFEYSYLVANPSAVVTCRNAGVDVGAWTVDSPSAVDSLLAIGVTKIISNYFIGEGK